MYVSVHVALLLRNSLDQLQFGAFQVEYFSPEAYSFGELAWPGLL